jgi:hypothetical protein
MPSAAKDDTSSSEFSDWDLEEDRLEAKSTNQPGHAHPNLGHPPQNQPTQSQPTQSQPTQNQPALTTATAVQHVAPVLPAGGTHGTVTPSARQQKVPNVAATTFKTLKSYIRKTDAMYHQTLKEHRHQDAMDLAIMRSEAEADAADRAALRMIDRDVVKQHLLKNGKLDRRTSIWSLL